MRDLRLCSCGGFSSAVWLAWGLCTSHVGRLDTALEIPILTLNHQQEDEFKQKEVK